MSLEAGTPIGKYVVRRKLAEGGMAEIYLASARGPEGFEKEVVIKRIRSFLADDPEFVEMFKAEARLASRLNHANIVQIFDFDKHEDTFYLAMEYVRGRSLWEVRKRCREQMVAIPPTLVAQVGVDVARGLHYAHHIKERGKPVHLVHRDVTPHNVLMSWEGAVKLTDFGIAKAGNKLTSPGMLKGKFAYMSPEQARGDAVDARTDVFALGIVLWEMLTGGRLFEGDSDVAVLRAVQVSNIAAPGRLNPDVHPDLDAVVMKALERDVEKRFQTAQELERALGQFIISHAKTVDDTDLAGFLHRVYGEELADDGRDRTSTGFRAPLFDEPAPPPKRDPTAVMPSSSGPKPQETPPSWDEDAHASTYVVERPKRETLHLPSHPRSEAPPTVQVSDSQRAMAPASVEAQPGEVAAAAVGPAAGSAELSAVPVSPATAAPRPAADNDATFSVRPTLPAQVMLDRPAGPVSVAPPAPEDSTHAAIAKVRPKTGRTVGVVAGVAGLAAAAIVAAVVFRQQTPEPLPDTSPAPIAAPVADDQAQQAPAEQKPGTIAAAPSAPEVVDAGVTELAAHADGQDAEPTPAPEKPQLPPEDSSAAQEPVKTARTTQPVKPAAAHVKRESHASSGTSEHVGTGTLVIRAEPYATVFIDGEQVQELTGTGEYKLAPGKYVVKLVHRKLTREKVVSIRAGRRQLIEFNVNAP